MPHKDPEKRRAYRKEYGADWYQRHKEEVKERTRRTNKRRRQENKEWYRTYKSKLNCMICGENHIACLQFHHRDKSEKSGEVGSLIGSPIGRKRIIDEMEKCDVLCVNCHAKLHWREKHETNSWEEVIPSEE